jgi:hypothetical protein
VPVRVDLELPRAALAHVMGIGMLGAPLADPQGRCVCRGKELPAEGTLLPGDLNDLDRLDLLLCHLPSPHRPNQSH